MAITKETIVDKIEVVGEFKHIQVRRAIVIKEDGNEISRSAHRIAYAPDQDVSAEDEEVKAVANAVWTDSVKAAWKTHKENSGS
jgi:hypothetical protein|tara:strand:+ start:857 stop:1108 length:252 start_codon:yes stop_codon:yes gene_type:complete